MNKRTKLALMMLVVMVTAQAQAGSYVVGELMCLDMANTVNHAQRDKDAGVDYNEVMEDIRSPENLKDPKKAAALPIVSRLVGDMYDNNLAIPKSKLYGEVLNMCRRQTGTTVVY